MLYDWISAIQLFQFANVYFLGFFFVIIILIHNNLYNKVANGYAS